jgi:hypothetical protein
MTRKVLWIEPGRTETRLSSTLHSRSSYLYLKGRFAHGKGEENMKRKKLLICMGLVLVLTLGTVVNVGAGASKLIYLDWHNVVPAGSGDPNMFGDGTVTVSTGQAQICYNLRVFVYPGDGSNWPPTSTGIYRASAGSNGPLVADLHPDFSSPEVSGCVSVSSALAHDIKQHPSDFYMLVTSINHPDGAVRAQLIR